MEAAHKTSLAKGEVGIRERKATPTLQEFSERFLKWVAIERAAKPKTVSFYEVRARFLLAFEPIRDAALDKIDEALVAEFIAWRKGAAKTKITRRGKGKVEFARLDRPIGVCSVNRELAVLRRILHIARDWKVIASVPQIHLLPGEKGSERVVSHAEEEVYLAAAPALLRECVTLSIDTGLGPEEFLRVRWENVHFEPAGDARYGYIHNPYGKTKWRKRNLPMTARVQALLGMRFEAAGRPNQGYVFPNTNGEGHLNYDTINSQHDRTLARLGSLHHFRLYDLRHTFLTRLGEAGADAFTIQKMAGHSSILTSQRYVHPTPERVEQAISRLEDYNRKKTEELTAGMRVQ
jgi:integrase